MFHIGIMSYIGILSYIGVLSYIGLISCTMLPLGKGLGWYTGGVLSRKEGTQACQWMYELLLLLLLDAWYTLYKTRRCAFVSLLHWTWNCCRGSTPSCCAPTTHTYTVTTGATKKRAWNVAAAVLPLLCLLSGFVVFFLRSLGTMHVSLPLSNFQPPGYFLVQIYTVSHHGESEEARLDLTLNYDVSLQ